jgi:hypothetical protein
MLSTQMVEEQNVNVQKTMAAADSPSPKHLTAFSKLNTLRADTSGMTRILDLSVGASPIFRI